MVRKYQAYPEYKDSEVEWIGQIPQHWKTASFAKLFTIKAGGDVKTEFFSETQTEDHPYPIYTNANDEKAIYGYTSKSNYSPNTITVSGRGEVGFAAFRDHAYDAIIRLLVLSPFGNSDCKYFAYFINGVIDFRVESSAIGQLSTQQISPYKVAFPPPDEQKQIANFLDHETAKIDTLIEKQQQLIKLLKEKRQAVISHAVTKGLNPNAPMRDSGVEWLGEVPAHWEVKRIKNISLLISKGTTPSTLGGDFVDEGIRFLKAENIGKSINVSPTPAFYITEEVDALLARSRMQENDVLVIIAGATTGLASIVTRDILPANTNQAVSFVRPTKSCYSKLIIHWLSTNFVQRIIWLGAVQAAQPNLSMESLGNIPIAVPPEDELYKIMKVIEKQIDDFDALISKAQTAINLIQERRTALISAAVTGKIDVRDWKAPEQNQANQEVAA